MSLPGDARLPWPSHVASTTAVLDPLPNYVRGDPQRGWFSSFEPLLNGFGSSHCAGRWPTARHDPEFGGSYSLGDSVKGVLLQKWYQYHPQLCGDSTTVRYSAPPGADGIEPHVV